MTTSRTHWLALIVLDSTIVNFALPSICADLGFMPLTLAWGVNAYLLTFGGFLLLGGVLTGALTWHWIFLVNLPIGVASLLVLPASAGSANAGHLDVAGVITVTAALTLAVYAIFNGNEAGRTSLRTLGLFAVAVALLAAFLWIETRTPSPLASLGQLRERNVATANGIGVLWAAAMFAWFFLSALYLQAVVGYSPLLVGVFAKLVMRFGIKVPLAFGLALAAGGLLFFAGASVHGNFALDVLPGMILLGFGAGIVNTPFMIGGAVGLAILASLVASHSASPLASGASQDVALNGGLHVAFLDGDPCAPLPPQWATRFCACPVTCHKMPSSHRTSWSVLTAISHSNVEGCQVIKGSMFHGSIGIRAKSPIK